MAKAARTTLMALLLLSACGNDSKRTPVEQSEAAPPAPNATRTFTESVEAMSRDLMRVTAKVEIELRPADGDGAVAPESIYDSTIRPSVERQVRDVLGDHDVSQIDERRDDVTAEMRTRLVTALADIGVEVNALRLAGLELPDRYLKSKRAVNEAHSELERRKRELEEQEEALRKRLEREEEEAREARERFLEEQQNE